MQLISKKKKKVKAEKSQLQFLKKKANLIKILE